MNSRIFTFFRKALSGLSRARFPYTPLITVTLSKSALLHNLEQLRKICSVTPVLKSNAYGHGLIEVARILDTEGCPFLIVDSYFEALTLRNAGIVSPILIIGYTLTETIANNRLPEIIFSITGLDALSDLTESVSAHAPKSKPRIHLKIDTGMNRQGILANEIDIALEKLTTQLQTGNILLEGIFSHLSDADNTDNTFTLGQIKLWNTVVVKTEAILSEKRLPALKYTHIANSAGHAYAQQATANISRSGIALYGINENAPVDKILDLTPVLEMKTIVSGIKKISKGSMVGYSKTFESSKETTIATIPAGYFEGIDRRLSNIGSVKINEKFAPIIGRVSMNITTIDVSDLASSKRGTPVIIMSRNTSDKNSVENIAKSCNTIPYEILVHIPGHLRRLIVD